MYQPQNILGNSIITFLFIIFLFSTFVLVFWIFYLLPFTEKRKYIKMEISRTKDEENIFWKKELKKLYICQIPFLGKILAKRL